MLIDIAHIALSLENDIVFAIISLKVSKTSRLSFKSLRCFILLHAMQDGSSSKATRADSNNTRMESFTVMTRYNNGIIMVRWLSKTM